VLLPKGKNVVRPGANEFAEMWRAAASLERLDPKLKEQLGQQLLGLVQRSPAPTYAFWALTRVGARSLLYGPLNAVLHPHTIESWLDQLFGFKPSNESERLGWAFCLAQFARRSGQRSLDVNDSHAARVLEILRDMSVLGNWVRMVEEVIELEGEERSQMFGESLPIGLKLAAAE
jgi:hypothetical protein